MQLSGAPLADTGPPPVTEMSRGEVLRLSRSGVTNHFGQNVCWVAPVVHMLVKDAVVSDFLLSKDILDDPTSVQSQLVMLVDQFQNSQAINLEDLLDALALSFQGSSRTLLSRHRADGQRKAMQRQLEWSEAAQFMLDALTSSSVAIDDETVWISMFQFLEQNFHSCGIADCGKTKPLEAPQPSWVLHLAIQQNMSLDAALEQYFFGTDCASSCSSCTQLCVQECTRLCRLPVTLLINIRRASKWVKTGAVKSTASLQYPMELPMAKFCTTGAVNDKWGSMYRLGGVVLHFGEDGNGGHYKFVQRQPTGNWLLLNDAEDPVSKSPAAVLRYRQLVCGLVYSRTPIDRDTSQELYSQLPSPWRFEDMALGKLPVCETALTTLPAMGTAKHKLTPLQLADLESKQAEVVAQREAADKLKAEQAMRQAETKAELRRQNEKEQHQRAEVKVDNAKERIRVMEARRLQKAAQEQAALEQQKKAARAAQDVARAAAREAETRVSQTEVVEATPDEAAPAPTTRKGKAQARLAARRVELAERKAEQAASAAAAQQLIESQAAAQKAAVEAPLLDAAAQQQLLSSSFSAEAAAATTQPGADKAQQELAAQAAEAAAQAKIKAAEVVNAAQQQLEAASGQEYAETAERQPVADAAAAIQKEAAVTAEDAAQRQMVANAAAVAAAKETAQTAEADQRQMAAAAARQEAAEAAAAAQQELQANAVAAADMQTAEAAAAVQQNLQAEAAAAEPAQRQPLDMAAEHANQEAAECAAPLEKAAATARLQTQLDAAAAARTWDFEHLHTPAQLSAIEQPTSWVQQVHAGLFEQEVKEATVTTDQQSLRKEPDLLASQLGTAKEVDVNVVRKGCVSVPPQITHSSSQLHQHTQQADLGPSHSHNTADEQISAKPGAGKQVLASPKAPHASKASMSTEPATTASPQASTCGSLNVTQTQQRNSLALSASAVESPMISSFGQLQPLDSAGANSCPADVDLGKSHSTAEEQIPAAVSARSGAVKQVVSLPHAFKAAANSTPATTGSAKADTLGQTDTKQAATAAVQQHRATAVPVAPRVSASHGSHDKYMSPMSQSPQPGATSCCGSSSFDNHARAGSDKQHDATSGSAVHEHNTAHAKADAEASRSAAQAPDAEKLFASWHGGPAPPPHPKQQSHTRPKRGFFRKVLHGARKLVQELDSARQQHPYQVAALGIAAGVALAATVTLHHTDCRRSAKNSNI